MRYLRTKPKASKVKPKPYQGVRNDKGKTSCELDPARLYKGNVRARRKWKNFRYSS